MVSFLLDNSLGAWWAARRLSEADLASAESEQALRAKASLPGVPLEYLRFVKDEETGHWTPAAGTFDAWPQSLAELKTLDPCCGSGHFLVAALLMLVPMRMELEGLNARDAVDAVLRDNLHGLEIDQRCVELAAFALALTAWRYPGTGGYRKLPELHLACSGLPISVAKEEWKALGLGKKNLTIALDWLYDSFKDAPILGSLLDPTRTSAAKIAQWEELSEALNQALSQEHSDEQHEAAVTAKGTSKAASLLSKKNHLVMTNFPFLGLEKQSERLRSHLKNEYPDGCRELATSFLLRSASLSLPEGTIAAVMPGEWTFLRPHRHFRKNFLTRFSARLISKLGKNSFSTTIRAQPTLVVCSPDFADKKTSSLMEVDSIKFEEKEKEVKTCKITTLHQSSWLENSDQRISKKEKEKLKTLGEFAEARNGMSAGDSKQFERNFWEIDSIGCDWEFLQSSVNSLRHYSGRESIIFWENGSGKMRELADKVKHLNHAAQNWQRGMPSWGRTGISLSLMGDLPSTIYFGNKYDKNNCAIVAKKPEYLPALVAFGLSGELGRTIRSFDSSLKVDSPKTILSTKIDFDKWKNIADEWFSRGLPKPYSDDPTQWVFHGHPCGSVIWDEEAKWTAHGHLRTDDTVLQVAVARLLGYRWPAEKVPEMELAEEQHEWVKRCEALLGHADRDGIVCLPAVRGERRAVDRLEALLADAYGDQWSATTRGKLLESVDHAGKDLESWLRDKFFAQHCKLFQNRPFIWHIWDGLKDGFSALVNYHRLDYKALETLTYTYLGDWITQQKKQISDSIDGAEARLAAAEALQKSLELILEGEEPYDIFVRWKPLEEQPIGWHPDLNDGVRLNIRPFLSVPDVKKKGAGVLVHKPNIHWKKDRGKDVESAPWYNLGPNVGGAKGDRINDYHLTLSAKKAARKP